MLSVYYSNKLCQDGTTTARLNVDVLAIISEFLRDIRDALSFCLLKAALYAPHL